LWHECDLRAAPTNVRSWESNGLNTDVAFGPFMTHLCHSLINFTAWHSSVSLNDVVMCNPRFEDGF